jgi:hypothetical protein
MDLNALNDIIISNGLNYSSPLEVGSQQWNNGRLRSLAASYNINGVGGLNAQLNVLPDSFGDLTELALLSLEWLKHEEIIITIKVP